MDENRRLGPGDRVTLCRAVLAGGVAALVADGAPEAVIVVLASVALVLDGVDGQVARRTGTASERGARFDLEVDAFLILVLSVQVALDLGLWVLAIGTMRYAFGAARWALPWLRTDPPPDLARKAVAVAQGVVLVVASAGVVPRPAMIASVALALVLLAWSFGRDIVWLWFDRAGKAGNAGKTVEADDGARGACVLGPVPR